MALRLWPLTRGRGWLLRASRGVAGERPIRVPIGRGALIEGCLDDWMTVWSFMGLLARDKPFQRSLDLATGAEVVFDVGAHVGMWSLLAARRNPAARIHAFEPSAAAVDRLCGHVTLNRADRVVEIPVRSAQNALARFYRHGNTGASSFTFDDQVGTRVPDLTRWTRQNRRERTSMREVDVEGTERSCSGCQPLLASDAAPIVFFG
jgi:FkbM family methyltransferase